ncbi:2-hydroxyacid dehydrogenase [Parvibaculum sp. MBR-TMA-1.3b-4.2]|jgi:glyoxylate reductase
MARPTILITRKWPDRAQARAADSYEVRLNEDDRLITTDELVRAAQGCDALLPTVTDRLDAAAINALPASIKIIATASVGYDHIDIAAAQARGIAVTNTPDVLTEATAEIAILLMLGAARGATVAERMLRQGEWKSWSPTGMLGIEVSGKRMAILGMGRIGKSVARKARAFGMEIHYHNRRPLDPGEAEGAIFHETADSLFKVADVLSINCASTPETRGLVNADRLALLPDDAVLVNTARGDIVDDEALIAGLKTGRPAAAGLDVFNNEPNFHRGYLELGNVFLLPHLGSATLSTRTAMAERALDNLDAFFKENKPGDLVTA